MCIFSINSLFIGPQVMPPLPPTPGFGHKLKPNPALCSAHKLEYGSIGPFTRVGGFLRGSKSIPVRFWGQKIEGRLILDSLHFWPIVGTVWGKKASKQRHYKENKLRPGQQVYHLPSCCATIIHSFHTCCVCSEHF
jgi:hypothetical protein